MSDATQNSRAQEAILSVANGGRSYDQVTVKAGQVLSANEVVGIITATGLVVSYDNDAADGSEVAVGVLTEACDATGTDKIATIVARDAEISKDKLVWGAGVTTEPEKEAAYDDLNNSGIVARD